MTRLLILHFHIQRMERSQYPPVIQINCYRDFREGNGTPLQYSCLENPMDGGAQWAAVHGVAKSRTRLSDFTFTFHFHALEKEMATHSSVLAWRIPGTGSLVGCRLCGRTELDTTEVTQQQQQSQMESQESSSPVLLTVGISLRAFQVALDLEGSVLHKTDHLT